MSYIRVDMSHTVVNGSNVSFKAPCDCHAVAGLKVYFPNDMGIATNQVFLFTDAHGNNLTGIGHLFAAGAIVKVILNLDESKAYIQNADTNAYLENRFATVKGAKVYTATIGTNWTTDENTGISTQNVVINGVTADHTAKVDHSNASVDGTSEGYTTFVEEENQYLTCITNGYAETYDGGIKFVIFGDTPTVSIPVIVEVV